MPEPFTEEEIRTAFLEGLSGAGAKWKRRFLRASGVAEKAKSPAAEATYKAKMQAVLDGSLRLKGLAGVTEDDIKGPVRDQEPSIWSGPTSRKAPKMAKKGLRFINEAVRVSNTLVAPVDDVDANIDNRVKPIGRALRALKRGGGGGGA